MSARAGDPGLSPAKAALLQRWREGEVPAADAGEIQPAAGSGPLPLSLAQQRLWFLEQFQPGTPAYNLFYCARVGGALDPEALARGVDDLSARHETLRTTFRVVDGSPVQVFDEGEPVALEVHDLREAGGGGLDAALKAMDEAIHRPFDLHGGPLARILLCRLRDGDVLGVVVHHLVGDGWSLGVALRELSALYEARAAGREPSLPPLPIRHGDFVTWQRASVREEDWQDDLAYWRRHLADPPVLELPTDRPRPAVMSMRGDWRELRVPRALSDALRTLARSEDATVFMVLLAGLAVLLHKLSGQPDLTVGTAIAGRTRSETFGLVGNFINMLAVRTDVDGDPTLREVLARARAACLGAYAHQQAPFERVVGELQPDRDLSRGVLFQTVLVLQPPMETMRFAGHDLTGLELGSRTVRSDLEFHLWEQQEISGRVAFSTDLFDGETVDRLVRRLVAVLELLVSDPDRRLSDCTVVLPDERALLDGWGEGPQLALPGGTVIEAFAERAAQAPGAPAVRAGGQDLDYGTLDGGANRLAHHLRSLGAGPEARVGVCLPRTAAMVLAVLGVLKAGAAYVPLDPAYPPERLALMLRDARAPILVTDTSLAAGLEAAGATTVCLDRDRDAIAAWPAEDPAAADPGARPDPDNLAYVIYTSGSTGTPKGVQISHRCLLNLVLAMRERLGTGPGDVQPSVASLSFDASVAELWPTLASGGCVLLAGKEDVVDGERLCGLLRDGGATALQATATIWGLVLGAGGLGDARVRALCGGEATPAELAEELAEHHDVAWNMYGPTEVTVWTSSARLRRGAPVSLGRPLANLRIRVLDDGGLPVPLGVTGELCIGGVGLARGYLDRPGMTAERFVPDPRAPAPGARLYRTGDLARWRPGGTLEFAGRRDDQIKLRGHRIELGDIEANLQAHEEVARAVVARTERAPGDARLVAYVVPRDRAGEGEGDRDGLASRLRSHLRTRVPGYMLPSAYVLLDELPTTPTGKIDRTSLPDPSPAGGEEAGYVEPRTDLEREVAELAASYLGIERMGVRSDFFELGGHSLLAASLMVDLRERYEVELQVQEIFVTPTVEHVAALIDRELARKRRFAGGEDEALREAVAGLSDEAVEALLGQRLSGER